MSTMVNFLHCTNMYFSTNGVKCIVFQIGFPNITVYYRKFQHNFLENIDNQSREGVNCLNLPKYNSFVLSDDDALELYCGGCFGKQNKLVLPLM